MRSNVLLPAILAHSVRQGRKSGRTCMRLLYVLSLSVLLASTVGIGTAWAGDKFPNVAVVTYRSGGASIKAFVARPQGTDKHAAVLLIHDDPGVTPGVQETLRRLAADGFVAIAPDFFSRLGRADNPENAESGISALPPRISVADAQAALRLLKADPAVDAQKISCIGFGWGGWRTFVLAAAEPELRHVVIFYGATPISGLEKVRASVLANYAQYDFFDTGNSIWTEDTLAHSGAKFTSYIYPKTFRGFFDSGNPHYNPEAARIAWSRTLEFLKR